MTYWPLEDAEPAADEPEMLLARKESASVLVPQALIDDYAGMDDLIGKLLRGEIKPKPLPPPKRHRCLACWLVSLLPGHERCEHGYLESGCPGCEGWS